MNALILLAQAFFNHQTQLQTQNLKIAGIRAAETGRRMAIAGVFFALAGAFIFAAMLIALIDLGLQIDRAHGVVFSGLMISSSILIFLGILSALAGWMAGRDPKPSSVPMTVSAPPSGTTPGPYSGPSELRPLLEAVAVSFLKDFLERNSAKTPPTSETES